MTETSSASLSTSGVMIGLEVHVQLATRTKLFCGCKIECKNDCKTDREPVFEQKNSRETARDTNNEDLPNTRTCVVCLGHPGSKPVVNKNAIQSAMRIATSFGCSISQQVHFSRKTYFYPDLAKNYQITQYEIPLGIGGTIVLDSGKVVRLRRVHVEEDPASLVHHETFSLVDYNRSGIPLVEIVTEPDMSSAEEARELLKKIVAILTYLEVINESCVVKADVNVSVKEKGYTRVEIKNVTGMKEVSRAVTYEILRQRERESNDVIQETRQWDAVAGITKSLRLKESEEDYGYIIEPDIPTITISDEWKKQVLSSIPELGEKKALRFVQEFGLDKTDARVLSIDPAVAGLFERLAAMHNPVLVARWLRRELLRVLNTEEKNVSDVKKEHLSELFTLLEQKKITDKIGQQLMLLLAKENVSPQDYVKKNNLGVVADDVLLRGLAEDVVKENSQAVLDYSAGKEEAFNFLVGQIMKKTRGRAAPERVRELLREVLEK